MALGATSHGRRNYENGAGDETFIRDRKNHLVLHALRYLDGDTSDDHLGAILANAAMLARLEEMAAVPEREHARPRAGDLRQRGGRDRLQRADLRRKESRRAALSRRVRVSHPERPDVPAVPQALTTQPGVMMTRLRVTRVRLLFIRKKT